MNNPMIDEIRKARADLAEEHCYDLVRLNEWAQKQTETRRRQTTQPLASKPLVQATEPSLSSRHSMIRTSDPGSTLATVPVAGSAQT